MPFTITFINYFCEHKYEISQCLRCGIIDPDIMDMVCQHKEKAISCPICFKKIIVDDDKKLPYLVHLLNINPNSEASVSLKNTIKEKEPVMWTELVNNYSEIFSLTDKTAPSADLDHSQPTTSNKTQQSLTYKDTGKDKVTPANNKSTKTLIGLDRKFIFKGNYKCQHNLEIYKCDPCKPNNTDELMKSKCLHRIPVIECNHCKDLFLILKNERDKTRIELIRANDYISFPDFEKIYLVNKKSKKTKHNTNDNIKKPDPKSVINNKGPKDNTRKNSLEDKNNTDIIVPISNTGPTKRDFSILESQQNKELELTKQEQDKTDPIEKSVSSARKPPPIIIINEEIKVINEFLTSHDVKYTLKDAPNGQIKLLVKSEDDYNKVLLKFVELEVKFYTFQFSSGKTTKRLISGLPINFETEKIKNNLVNLIPEIIIKNIRQIHNAATKKPLPLFEISFSSSGKINEKIEKIKTIENIKIKIDKINPKYIEIPICKSCLNYGHTKSYCKIGITCIICNESHHSSVCPLSLKAKEENSKVTPICLHCKEPHFTTWKGCKFYKKLRKAKLENYQKQNLAKKNEHSTDKIENPENLKKSNDENKELKNQLKELELKFDKEISLLNSIIMSLKNEISSLNNKLVNVGNIPSQ
ncbi:unnamed protein product [Bemisia tabaci]|uniref:Pre-C2HC domain-containing protein n=1 Tax=Bemisia tabaci TaxID=7038 RepID=A0A9P0F7R8_BEMTA|nr:unnamed protein product [Bemisia tabaci]